MALSRRTGQRFQASIWPGFVDAMTGLLLVLMFVLTIFMVVQFVLRETISGQASELDALSAEVAALADALGLERQTVNNLRGEISGLNATIGQAQTEAEQQAALIASLRSARAAQDAALADAQGKITGFEAQVAGLLAERDKALGAVATLEGEQAKLLSAQEALQLAIAQARSEIDAQAEAARLAAAKREALEALAAELKKDGATAQGEIAVLQSKLSAEEAARIAEAAAAEKLREKLKTADTELTAMTLALEEQRKRAEDTLTMLAAAQAGAKDLDVKLAAALLAQSATEAELEAARAARAKTAAALVATKGEAADQAEELAAEKAKIEAQLAAALAAKLAAENAVSTQMSAAERQAALLAAANAALAEGEAQSAASQRQAALLNQQIAALRGQLGGLQSLLDEAEARDATAQVQLQSLGSKLNTALAQVAAEERKRRQLEEAERKRLEAETKNLEKYKSEFFGRLRDVLGSQEGVRIVGDRFVFSSEVLFPPGGAVLSEQGQSEIAKIAGTLRGVIKDIPEGIDWVIRVDGHTDNVPLSGTGQFADNWELSQARALSVVRYMADFLGIPPDRLSANGFGQYQPIDPADTTEARAQNRRIELKFTEK